MLLAAREGAIASVECLLRHGASKDITDQLERLPRDVAIEYEHMDVVKCLDTYTSSLGCHVCLTNEFVEFYIYSYHQYQCI